MFTKKRVIWLIILVLIFILAIWLSFYVIRYRNVVQASATFPYQIGLTDVVIIPCFTTGIPPVCTGGTLCHFKDAATCSLYSDVSGAPAGGMGSEALFLKTAITATGLTSGGQLIAGGTSPVLMDNGVLASTGGVFYATAKKINSVIDFAIAIFK
jgi:hypothetical protein